ncbi:MAG: hypothetical protein Q8M22_05285 [Actinomycetota bacterium]|nr:hypothetical protein [Actinomycetota bacterium]
MRRRILGALIAVGALSTVAEPTTNLENDRSFLVQMDPMTMSDVQLAGAFPHEFEYLKLTYGLDNDGAADALRLTWTAGNTRSWAMTSLPGFAGAWVDYTQSRVFVGVADGVVVSQRSHRALAAAAGPRAARPTLVAMPRSYDELVDDAARIHDLIDPTGDEMIEVEIDERRGALNVAGLSHAEATANAAVARVLGTEGFPQVNWRAANITDPTDVTGGWDAQQGAGCTMAFTVVSPSNTRAVLTAGHCADNPVKTGQVTLSTAQQQRSFWPWLGGSADSGYDRQLHLVPPGTMTAARLQAPNVLISGSFLPTVGSVICRYGAASVARGQAPAFCSVVTAYGYDGFVGMGTGCIYGDSGGPSWVMGKAVGIAAVTSDPEWPVDGASTCWMAPVKDQLNGTGYFLQDATYGYGSDFRAIGLFHPIGPTRVFDSRGAARVNGETEIALGSLLNQADLGAAVLSVTVVPRGRAGYATVYPGDDGFVPSSYSVSYDASGPESNLVISRVNRYTKRLKVFTSQSVDLIVDVLGYYSDTSGADTTRGAVRVVPLVPARVYDSRPIAKLVGGTTRDIQVRGRGGVPATATAVIANLTVTHVSGAGFLTAHAGGTKAPGTSNLNFTTGQTKARLAIVPLDSLGRIRLTAGGPATESVIVDVQGYLESTGTATAGRTFATDGGGGRVFDTRSGLPVGVGTSTCIDLYASRTETANGLPREGLLGVWLSTTVADASASGYLVVSPRGSAVGTSNVNFVPGGPRTNLVFVALPSSTDGHVCFKVAGATAHLIADVVAYTVG